MLASHWEAARTQERNRLPGSPAIQRTLFLRYEQKLQGHVNWINDLSIRCGLLLTTKGISPGPPQISPFLQEGTPPIGLICLLNQHNQHLLWKFGSLYKKCSLLPPELWGVLKTKLNNKKEVNWIGKYTSSFLPKLSCTQCDCFSKFNYY